MLNYLKANNVRVYAVVVAALALVAHYVPDLPVALIVGVAAAILGVGERVNAKTVHKDHVAIDARHLEDNEAAGVINYGTETTPAYFRRADAPRPQFPNAEDPDA